MCLSGSSMKSQLSSALRRSPQHRVDVDHLARQGDAFGLVGPQVLNRQRDARAGFALAAGERTLRCDRPSVVLPSISRIWSPACRPAR